MSPAAPRRHLAPVLRVVMSMNRLHRAHLAAVHIVALLTLLAACGGAATEAARPPAASPAVPATPTLDPAPAGPRPRSLAAPAPSTPGHLVFTARIVHSPGARVRYGPGLDMPVMDLDRAGRTETFDGWFRRTDDTPLADDVTGRVETWSRDWFHLANGGGWVHSAAVLGSQPAAMPEADWKRPTSLPSPTAGLVEVAADRQEHHLTCEVASLRMALRARGITTDEQALLQLTGVDLRPAELDAGGAIRRWGNPDQTFVGNPDGHESDHTGYGVYAAPIARAAMRAGATVLASGTGIAPSSVYAAVFAGHPAVTWVTNDLRRGNLRNWVAWDGSAVTYTPTEHAVLLVGVTPTAVLVNDPLVGQAWHVRADFEAAYATLGDMAVVLA